MKSSIKPVFKCSDIHKNMFGYSRCLLTISVGQEVHEAEKFSATIDLVNNFFKSCVILVDDSLQRHTMALNTDKDAEYFYKQSVIEGDLWLERNDKYLSKLSILENVMRWDTWLKHTSFVQQKKEIQFMIDNDPNYMAIFEETINEFLRRYTNRLDEKSHFDIKKARLLCFDYLLEECVAICLWPQLNCHFEVYPNKRNAIMAETHKRFVLPKYPDLLHSVAIKFKNRKQFQAQSFELKFPFPESNILVDAIVAS